MEFKIGDSVFHRGLGREVEIVQEFSSHYQCRDGKIILSAAKTSGVDLVPVRKFEVIDGGEKDGSEVETININEVSGKNLGAALKGLGHLAARRIIERKPEGGYVGVEQLKVLNSDVNVNWEALLPHIAFS